MPVETCTLTPLSPRETRDSLTGSWWPLPQTSGHGLQVSVRSCRLVSASGCHCSAPGIPAAHTQPASERLACGTRSSPSHTNAEKPHSVLREKQDGGQGRRGQTRFGLPDGAARPGSRTTSEPVGAAGARVLSLRRCSWGEPGPALCSRGLQGQGWRPCLCPWGFSSAATRGRGSVTTSPPHVVEMPPTARPPQVPPSEHRRPDNHRSEEEAFRKSEQRGN